jgi:hypothetical protein
MLPNNLVTVYFTAPYPATEAGTSCWPNRMLDTPNCPF